MFKEIFLRLTKLIFKPSEAWASVPRGEDEHEAFLSRYIYPLFGLIALAAFLGVLCNRKEFDFAIALKATIMSFVSAAGGFLLGAYLLNELWQGVFKRPKNMKQCMYFVGYASAVMFLRSIVLSLLPEFFFLHVIILYTVYIIWEGAMPFMEVQEDQQLKFTIIASIVIILSPIVIYYASLIMMPNMRF